MKRFILDASVVLTFLSEKRVSIAKEFEKILKDAKDGKARLYSTYLLPLEIGNGLRFSLKDEELACQSFKKILNLPIELIALSSSQLTKILKLSFQFKTSFYDTSYHFLARVLKGTFLTCDSNYFKKAKEFGNIKLL